MRSLMAQHLLELGMVLPVNIMFSDPTRQAARMLIETTDCTPRSNDLTSPNELAAKARQARGRAAELEKAVRRYAT